MQINKVWSNYGKIDFKKNLGSPKEFFQKKTKDSKKVILNESPVYNVKNLKINFFKIIKKQKEKSHTKKVLTKNSHNTVNKKPKKKSQSIKKPKEQQPKIENLVFDLNKGMQQI